MNFLLGDARIPCLIDFWQAIVLEFKFKFFFHWFKPHDTDNICSPVSGPYLEVLLCDKFIFPKCLQQYFQFDILSSNLVTLPSRSISYIPASRTWTELCERLGKKNETECLTSIRGNTLSACISLSLRAQPPCHMSSYPPVF